VAKLKGEYVYRMQGESGDNWVLWVSGPHLVKLGAPEGSHEVPGELLGLYLDKYPSDLNDKGKADDDAPSAGPALESNETSPDAGAAPPEQAP
jgi:hypothetical protein